jgi:tRNA G10  N-methylase Trm11
MKKNFRNERLKARYKGVSGTIKLQSGKIVHGSPEKILLRDMNYFAFENPDNKEVYFGYLDASYDSSESEKRDMEKPFRRESLAISPRLARILINLSQVKKGENLLDPFCGIGVILGEGMLRGINVIGVDIDASAIADARKNMNWFGANYSGEANFKIINGDSRVVKVENVDGVATEPSLGELMKNIPQREKAKQIIYEFENLMIDVINNIMKEMKKGAKMAFTAPLLKTQSGRVSCNIGRICDNTGLRIYEIKDSCIEFPIQEYREDSIVGRDIFVLTA